MGAFDSTIGAVLIAALVASLLQGFQIASATTYVTTYWATEILVIWVTILSLLSTAATCAAAYDYAVTKFGDPSHLGAVTWNFPCTLLCLGLVSLSVQSFFAYRLYVLSGRGRTPLQLALPITIVVLSFASVALDIGGAVLSWIHPSLDTIHAYSAQIYAWGAMACAADALITGSISYYLYKAKGDFEQTNQIINRLIWLLCETNAVSLSLSIIIELDGKEPANVRHWQESIELEKV